MPFILICLLSKTTLILRKNMNMEKAEIYKIKGEGMVWGYRNGVSMGWDASDRDCVWCAVRKCG